MITKEYPGIRYSLLALLQYNSDLFLAHERLFGKKSPEHFIDDLSKIMGKKELSQGTPCLFI